MGQKRGQSRRPVSKSNPKPKPKQEEINFTSFDEMLDRYPQITHDAIIQTVQRWVQNEMGNKVTENNAEMLIIKMDRIGMSLGKLFSEQIVKFNNEKKNATNKKSEPK
jgi:hypothetical protein